MMHSDFVATREVAVVVVGMIGNGACCCCIIMRRIDDAIAIEQEDFLVIARTPAAAGRTRDRSIDRIANNREIQQLLALYGKVPGFLFFGDFG